MPLLSRPKRTTLSTSSSTSPLSTTSPKSFPNSPSKIRRRYTARSSSTARGGSSQQRKLLLSLLFLIIVIITMMLMKTQNIFPISFLNDNHNDTSSATTTTNSSSSSSSITSSKSQINHNDQIVQEEEHKDTKDNHNNVQSNLRKKVLPTNTKPETTTTTSKTTTKITTTVLPPFKPYTGYNHPYIPPNTSTTSTDSHTTSEGTKLNFPFVDLQDLIEKLPLEEQNKRKPQNGLLVTNFMNQQKGRKQPVSILESKQTEVIDPLSISTPATAAATATTMTTTAAAILTRRGFKGGPLNKQINQDRAILTFSPTTTSSSSSSSSKNDFLMGIFDGHGTSGHYVSHHVAMTLPKTLFNHLSSSSLSKREESLVHKNKDDDRDDEDEYIKRILEETLQEVDRGIPPSVGISGGCTASMFLYRHSPDASSSLDKIYAINTGDSLSFIASYHHPSSSSSSLSSNGDKPKVQIVYETRKDKPDLPDERARIESMGGKVVMPRNNADSSRVLIPSKEATLLAMSRSLGDWDGRKVGVIPDPIVDIWSVEDLKDRARILNLEEKVDSSSKNEDVQLFAVSASDGLFDLVPQKEIAETLGIVLYNSEKKDQLGGSSSSSTLQLDLVEACEELIEKSSSSWRRSFGGYRDDISLVVTKIP